jgi:GNAT superfamily N-acetyltransferase
MQIRVVEADYGDPAHARDVAAMTNAYALDEMGGGRPLPEDVMRDLVPGLRRTPGAISFIAYDADTPVGVANCFLSYSTFSARPLINVHDLGVIAAARGRGVGKALLDAIAVKAKTLGGCKLTLEVLEHNPAQRLYEREGFTFGEPRYLFMTRPLD